MLTELVGGPVPARVTTMQIDSRLLEIDDCLYRLAVKAFVLHDGKLLLVREKDDEWWNFPGGGIDYGETIAEALPRELAEELGVPAADITTDYQVAYVAVGAVVNGVPRANLFYRVTVAPDQIHDTDDVLEFGWFTPAEIAKLHTGPFAVGGTELMTVLESVAQEGCSLPEDQRKVTTHRPSVADRKG